MLKFIILGSFTLLTSQVLFAQTFSTPDCPPVPEDVVEEVNCFKFAKDKSAVHQSPNKLCVEFVERFHPININSCEVDSVQIYRAFVSVDTKITDSWSFDFRTLGYTDPLPGEKVMGKTEYVSQKSLSPISGDFNIGLTFEASSPGEGVLEFGSTEASQKFFYIKISN